MARISLFGGAFDPIHNAHLAIAREAARAFHLDRVLFVPAASPPHKRVHAPYEDRYRMVELALAGEPGLEPSRLEAGAGQTFSIDTIEQLGPRLGSSDELYFLIGGDAFAEIESWKRWRDVVRAVQFIVVSRPGHIYAVPDGARLHRLDTLNLNVSSSEIRRRLAEGDDQVEVPAAVLRYMRERELYRRSRPTAP